MVNCASPSHHRVIFRGVLHMSNELRQWDVDSVSDLLLQRKTEEEEITDQLCVLEVAAVGSVELTRSTRSFRVGSAKERQFRDERIRECTHDPELLVRERDQVEESTIPTPEEQGNVAAAAALRNCTATRDRHCTTTSSRPSLLLHFLYGTRGCSQVEATRRSQHKISLLHTRGAGLAGTDLRQVLEQVQIIVRVGANHAETRGRGGGRPSRTIYRAGSCCP